MNDKTGCHKYIDVEITSEEYNKGFVAGLKEVARLILDNKMTIDELKGTLLFAIQQLDKKS
jgi:hypothetical protein